MGKIILQQQLPGIAPDAGAIWPPPDVPKRDQIKPLHEPAAIYAALSLLAIGERVPPEIYICDYDTGGIPPWMLKEREDLGESYHMLTTIDVSTRHKRFEGTSWVACDVFCCPTKILRTPLYTYYAGCVHEFNKLTDARQHARQIADRWQARAQGEGRSA